MSRTALPAGFSVLMAVVVVAGVGAGFAIGPRRAAPAPAAAIEPPTTLAPAVPPPTTTTTSTTVRAARPRCRPLGTAFTAIARPRYIAGTDANLLQRLFPLLGDISVVTLGTGADIRMFVPDNQDGILLLPFEDSQRDIPEFPRMRVIFYTRAPEPSRTWRGSQPALLLTGDPAPPDVPLRGNEDLVVDLITTGSDPQKCAP